MENVWDDSSTTLSNVVDVHIKHLRDKIDRPFGKSIIKTVSGIGYKLDPNPY
jgi:two-component system OmpR family response regulator